MIEYWVVVQGVDEEPEYIGPFESRELRDKRIREMIGRGADPEGLSRQDRPRRRDYEDPAFVDPDPAEYVEA